LYGLRTTGFGEVVRAQYAAYLLAAGAIAESAARVAHCRWSLPVPEVARILLTFTDGLTTTWLADQDTPAARATIRFAARAVADLAVPLTSPTKRTPRAAAQPAPATPSSARDKREVKLARRRSPEPQRS